MGEERACFASGSVSSPIVQKSRITGEVVFSRTLTEANWPLSTSAGGDLTAEFTALRIRPDGEDIAWAGARFKRKGGF